jgi:hypothetical protein
MSLRGEASSPSGGESPWAQGGDPEGAVLAASALTSLISSSNPWEREGSGPQSAVHPVPEPPGSLHADPRPLPRDLRGRPECESSNHTTLTGLIDSPNPWERAVRRTTAIAQSLGDAKLRGDNGAPRSQALTDEVVAASLAEPHGCEEAVQAKPRPEGWVTLDSLRAQLGHRDGPTGLDELGELTLRPTDSITFSRLVQELEEVRQRRTTKVQLRKDESSWNRYWVPITEFFNTASVRRPRDGGRTFTGAAAVDNETKLLCFALLLVMATMRPRSKSSPAAKPSSAVDVLLAVRRMHAYLGYVMVPFRAVYEMLRGLRRRFVQRHGHEALLVRRKRPISYDMLRMLLEVTAVSLPGGRTWHRNSLLGVSTAAMICLLYSGGFRKAEIVSGPEGCMPLLFSSLTWHLGGVTYAATPPAKKLRFPQSGDYVAVAPRVSKCDITGEIWGDKPVYLHYIEGQVGNAFLALAKLELAAGVAGEDRFSTPLFIDNAKQGVSAYLAVCILTALLEATVGVTEAFFFTWHSFRISLATRLHKAKCSDSDVQALCRWQSVESLRIYIRWDADDYLVRLRSAHTQSVLGDGTVPCCIDSGAAGISMLDDVVGKSDAAELADGAPAAIGGGAHTLGLRLPLPPLPTGCAESGVSMPADHGTKRPRCRRSVKAASPGPPPCAERSRLAGHGLPAGWTGEARVTPKGREYPVYFSPSGVRAYSRAAAWKAHLAEHDEPEGASAEVSVTLGQCQCPRGCRRGATRVVRMRPICEDCDSDATRCACELWDCCLSHADVPPESPPHNIAGDVPPASPPRRSAADLTRSEIPREGGSQAEPLRSRVTTRRQQQSSGSTIHSLPQGVIDEQLTNAVPSNPSHRGCEDVDCILPFGHDGPHLLAGGFIRIRSKRNS